MLALILSATSLTINPPTFQRREKFTKTWRLSNYHCNKSFGVLKHWCSFSKKSIFFFIFLHMHSGKSYHTDSSFTQHYNVCWVLFVLKAFIFQLLKILFNKACLFVNVVYVILSHV